MYCVTGRRGFGLDRAGLEIRDAATGHAHAETRLPHFLEHLMGKCLGSPRRIKGWQRHLSMRLVALPSACLIVLTTRFLTT